MERISCDWNLSAFCSFVRLLDWVCMGCLNWYARPATSTQSCVSNHCERCWICFRDSSLKLWSMNHQRSLVSLSFSCFPFFFHLTHGQFQQKFEWPCISHLVFLSQFRPSPYIKHHCLQTQILLCRGAVCSSDGACHWLLSRHWSGRLLTDLISLLWTDQPDHRSGGHRQASDSYQGHADVSAPSGCPDNTGRGSFHFEFLTVSLPCGNRLARSVE